MKNRREVQLFLEELGSRLLLSAGALSSSGVFHQSGTSSNWSGYAVDAARNQVTSVSGSWNVPTVTASPEPGQTAYSSVWVGIDGDNSNSVEQTGTEEDYLPNGQAQYSAWYEMYPAYPVTLSASKYPVQAKDQMTASVTYETSGKHKGDFLLAIADTTEHWAFSTYQRGSSADHRSSAEWIVEAPCCTNSGNILPLAQFSPVTFTGASATIGTNPVAEPINYGWTGTTLWQITMDNPAGDAASPGALEDSGSVFTVTWDSTWPT